MWRHKPIHPRYVYVHVYYIYIPTRHLYIIQYKYIVNKICIHISNVYTHTYYQKSTVKDTRDTVFPECNPQDPTWKSRKLVPQQRTQVSCDFLPIFSELIKNDFLDDFQFPSFWNQKNERCCRGTSKIPASWLPKKRTGWGRWRCPHRTWLCKTLGSTQHCQVWFLAGSDPWHLCMGQTPKQATCL